MSYARLLDALEEAPASDAGGRWSCLRREMAMSGAEVREAVASVSGGLVDFAERRMDGTSG